MDVLEPQGIPPGGRDGEGSWVSPSREEPCTDAEPFSRQTERRQARHLASAREAFAACVLRLPQPLRGGLFAGDESGPRLGSKWPLPQLEECFVRLLGLAARDADPRVASLVSEARRHRDEIEQARNTLVLANLGLVARVARQFDVRRLPFVDLFQEGTIGLINAVERFEWERGYKFSTYAYWWIRQAISSAVARESTFIRLSDHKRAQLRRCQRIAREIGASLRWSPDWHDVARRAGVPTSKLHELLNAAREPFSLEAPPAEANDDLLREMPDLRAPDPLQRTLDRERYKIVTAAMDELDSREKTILRHRFGIDGQPTYTLEEIGRMLELTRERVRQIEQTALRKIQRSAPGVRLLSAP